MALTKQQKEYLTQSIVGLEEAHTVIDAFRNGLQEEFDGMSASRQTGEDGEMITDLIDRLDNLFTDVENIIGTLYEQTQKKSK